MTDEMPIAPAFLARALKEWNAAQPAWTQVKTMDRLSAAEQGRVEQRARELEIESVMQLMEEGQ